MDQATDETKREQHVCEVCEKPIPHLSGGYFYPQPKGAAVHKGQCAYAYERLTLAQTFVELESKDSYLKHQAELAKKAAEHAPANPAGGDQQ